MMENIIPKGFIQVDLVDKTNGVVLKSLSLENFITTWGVQSIANQIISCSDSFLVDKVYYGDGYAGVVPDKSISKLQNLRGSGPLKNHTIQTILRASLTLLFRIDGDDIPEAIVINEIGLGMKNNKLFSYRHLEADETLLLEPGKRINITWTYRW